MSRSLLLMTARSFQAVFVTACSNQVLEALRFQTKPIGSALLRLVYLVDVSDQSLIAARKMLSPMAD